MTDSAQQPDQSRASAGAALRQARLAAGRNVEELAAQLKVSPAKITALEAGDWSALPDDTFARALLRSSCKALKIDAQPVLDLLPRAATQAAAVADAPDAAASEVSRVPQAPLRPRRGTARQSRGLLWLAVGIVVLAAAVYFWPALRGVVQPQRTQRQAMPVPTAVVPPAGHTASLPAAAASHVAQQSATPPEVAAASAPAAPASAASGGTPLQLTARAPSWVQVTASDGKVLFSQLMQPGAGQTVQIPAGSTPLTVVVGNAPQTTLVYAGKPVDLAPATRGNVARLTLR
ncbi:MAG: helix-turn-helix domain-containing protein [Thiomonas sp.]